MLWGLFYIGISAVILFGGLLVEKISTKSKYSKFMVVLFCFIIIFILAALKSTSVGRDTESYLKGYIELGNSSWSNLKYGSFEIGYSLIAKTFSKIGIPFQYFSMFLYIVVITLFAVVTYQKSKQIPITAFLFFAILFAFGLSAQRQILSAAIIAFGFLFLEKKKIGQYVVFSILCIIAGLIHKTSFIALVIIPLSLVRITKKTFLIFLLSLITIFIISQPLYQVFVYYYDENAYYPLTSGRGISFWVWVIIFVIVYLVSYTHSFNKFASIITKNDKKILSVTKNGFYNIILSIFFLSLLFYALLPASDIVPRFLFTFIFSFCLIVPYIYEGLTDKKIKILAICVLFIGFSFYFYFTSIRGNGLDIYPYVPFFF